MKKLILLLFAMYFLTSCGIYRPTSSKEVPVNSNERIKKNIEEGRGFRLGSIGSNKSGDFMFASSNPLWRASMEKLDFAPFSVVDYGGGVIITDWYTDNSKENDLKITVRFLSNEIRSDAIKVILHERACSSELKCTIKTIENTTNQEIKFAILKRAAELENLDMTRTKEEIGEYKIPGKNF